MATTRSLEVYTSGVCTYGHTCLPNYVTFSVSLVPMKQLHGDQKNVIHVSDVIRPSEGPESFGAAIFCLTSEGTCAK